MRERRTYRTWRARVARILVVGATIAFGLATSPAPGGAQTVTLPAGFSDTVVVTGLSLPTSMSFLPDGRMLVTLKTGAIVIVEDPTTPASATATYMTITDINAGNDERGIMNVVADPAFATNGHVYVYYSHNTTQRFRVSRFTHQENAGGVTSRGDLGSELVIWEDNEDFSACCHYGGGLVFASDGTMLLTTGEEFDGAQAADLGRAGGKVHRFASDGSIPATNPLHDGSPGATNAAGQLQTIVAYGLRNPFRASFDDVTQRLYIGEVGGNDNATSTEDIHVYPFDAASPPLIDMGWPGCEGICLPPGDPGNPIWAYPHAGSGASVTGGVVNRGSMFPSTYDGAYFFGDWVDYQIRWLEIDEAAPGAPAVASHVFLDTSLRPQSFAAGPDGSLYWLGTDNNFGGGGNPFVYGGEIHRISYTPDNTPPACFPTADVSGGPSAPLAVSFDAVASDADGDPMTYAWDFGDGGTSTSATPLHTYAGLGTYEVSLLVDDGTAVTQCPALTITVGTPPTVTIVGPADGTTFRAGDTIDISATAVDRHGAAVPAGDIEVSAVFVHNEHTHPAVGATPGGSATLAIPVDGHDYSSATGYRIFAQATDGDGLIGLATVDLIPDKVDLTIAVTPAAVGSDAVDLDSVSIATPRVHDTLIGFQHELGADPAPCVDGQGFAFVEWRRDGVTDTTSTTAHVHVPPSDLVMTAVYAAAGPCDEVEGALELVGATGVTVPAISLAGDFTIETWIRPRAGTSVTNADGIVANSAGTQDINFYNGLARLHDRTVGWDHIVAATPTPAGAWSHVALTRESGTLRLYVDGVLDATGPAAHTATLVIDRLGAATAGVLDGELDETRIWEVARTGADLVANRDLEIDPTTPGLLAYYRYDSLDEVRDLAGDDHSSTPPADGAIVASTSPVAPPPSQPPSLDAVADRSSNLGEPAALAVVASDPDGDPLTFAASGLPEGVSIHPATGAISGTPTSLGDHAVYVTASDPNGAAATQHFHWAVVDDRRVITPRTGAAIEGDVAAVALTLDRASAHPITVQWATVATTGSPAGVATSDVDFAAASGTATFLPGEVSVAIPVATLEDGLAEPPLLYGEWFFVAVSNPSPNAVVDTATFFGLGIGVIVDDD